MARKKRLVVMVEPSTYERLKQTARERETSLGACVREALARYGREQATERSTTTRPTPPWKARKIPPHLEKTRGLLAGLDRDVLRELEEERRLDRQRENAELRSR